MQLKLEIDYVKSRDTNHYNWWKESQIIEDCIIRCYDSNMISFNYLTFGDNFESFDLDSLTSLKEEIEKQYSEYGCFLAITKDKSDTENCLRFYVNESSIGINFFVSAEDESVYHELITIFNDLFISYREEYVFGPSIHLSVPDIDYSRYLPVRDYLGLSSHAVVNFIDYDYFNIYPNITVPEGLVNLRTLELPESASRSKINNLTTIIWGHESHDFEQVLMNREECIYTNLNLEPERNLNESGHKVVFNISSLEKPPSKEKFFSYYNPRTNMAFKLVTLTSDFELDAETESTIINVLESGESDSKLEVSKVVIILPSQETAEKVETSALDIGIYKVLYLDNEMDIWDLKPNGNWRN
ncbi:MAG: hypothetical protein ACFHU9_00655 [Fluviicola sp.]